MPKRIFFDLKPSRTSSWYLPTQRLCINRCNSFAIFKNVEAEKLLLIPDCLFVLSLSSCQEKATVALYFGQISTCF